MMERGQIIAIRSRKADQQDGYCWWCCKYVQLSKRTLEHLVPYQRGGDDHDLNLVMACSTCNARRGHVGFTGSKAFRGVKPKWLIEALAQPIIGKKLKVRRRAR